MKRLIGLAVFQVVVLLGWAAQNEYVRATAPTFRIPLQPRDPYDVLRGRYFILNPSDAAIKTGLDGVLLPAEEVKRFLGTDVAFVGTALVGFCPQEQRHRVCALARSKEPLSGKPGQYWSRAGLTVRWEDRTWRAGKEVPEPGYRVHVDLGLDRFFLPNRAVLPARENEPGWEVEVCHRPGLTPLPRRLLFKGQPVFGD
ncbi:MAG TPA: GDYXXLXY domain-containing protein [Vicinamibacteria bacterium]|nr:GDYXXLXY domain-containing protein [Vicinamibacteria bacterium]